MTTPAVTSVFTWTVEKAGREYEVEVFDNGTVLILDIAPFSESLTRHSLAQKFVLRLFNSAEKALFQDAVSIEWHDYERVRDLGEAIMADTSDEGNLEAIADVEEILAGLIPEKQGQGAVAGF